MGRMHIDKHHPHSILRKNKNPVHLCQRKAQRRDILGSRLLDGRGITLAITESVGRRTRSVIEARTVSSQRICIHRACIHRTCIEALERRCLCRAIGAFLNPRRRYTQRTLPWATAACICGTRIGDATRIFGPDFWPHRRQRPIESAENKSMYLPPIPEAHFMLRRMDIDVDPRRIELKKQDKRRVSTME